MPMLTTFLIGRPVAPFHVARPNGVGECAHPIEDLVHLGDDVDSVDDERAAARHPQRNVEHGAVLGHVDALPREHRVTALGNTCLSASATRSRSVSSVTRFLE